MESKTIYSSVRQAVGRPAHSFLDDAIRLGSPKGLRISLEQYEGLRRSGEERKCTTMAIGCAATAAVISLAPSLVAATKSCSPFFSSFDGGVCAANMGPAIGALVGLVGIVLTGCALHLDAANLKRFVNEKDHELRERFERTLTTEPERAGFVMTRYSRLAKHEREEVKKALFAAYLRNPRPAHAQPAVDHLAQELQGEAQS